MTTWLSPDAARAITIRGFGDWVDALDATVVRLCERFALQPIELLSGGTMGAVIRAKTQDGQGVVLKTSPSIETMIAERQFLERLAPGAGPRVLFSEPGSMVMELLEGSTESGHLGDDAAVGALVALNFWSSADPGTTSDISETLGTIAVRLSTRDPRLAAEFSDTEEAIRRVWAGEALWCHGDLQAENLFWDGQRLRIIDPLPVWAPKGLDIGYWAVDPLRSGPVSRRLTLLSQAFTLSTHEIHTWATLGAAQHLSWLWHHDVRPELSSRVEVTLRELISGRGLPGSDVRF